jgi:hypothetical protein
MRTLILLLIPALLVAGSAAPAAAQVYRDLAISQDALRAAEARAARNRDIATGNELSVMQAGAQTDRALNNIAASRIAAPLPTVPSNPAAPPPKIDPAQLAEIPDATLAASNARAVAAAANRH